MAVKLRSRVQGLLIKETELSDHILDNTLWKDLVKTIYPDDNGDIFLRSSEREVANANLSQDLYVRDALAQASPAGQAVDGIFETDRTHAVKGA